MKEIRFGFTGKYKDIHLSLSRLNKWWYILFAIAGSAIISASCSFVGDYDISKNYLLAANLPQKIRFVFLCPWLYFVSGFIAVIYGSRGTYIDIANLNEENLSLKEENKNIANLRNTINSRSEDCELLYHQLAESHSRLIVTWLKSTSNQLRLDTHDRITIYYFVDNHFYLLARYSKNPLFREIHRQKFPTQYGVISQAWQHKYCVDTEKCPEYINDPSGYIEHMKRNYSYIQEKIEKLHMKSCNFLAIAISEIDSPIGVIVFESEKNDHFKTQKIAQVKKYCREYQSYMCNFIKDGIILDKSAKTQPYKDRTTEEEFLENLIVVGGEK